MSTTLGGELGHAVGGDRVALGVLADRERRGVPVDRAARGQEGERDARPVRGARRGGASSTGTSASCWASGAAAEAAGCGVPSACDDVGRAVEGGRRALASSPASPSTNRAAVQDAGALVGRMAREHRDVRSALVQDRVARSRRRAARCRRGRRRRGSGRDAAEPPETAPRRPHRSAPTRGPRLLRGTPIPVGHLCA